MMACRAGSGCFGGRDESGARAPVSGLLTRFAATAFPVALCALPILGCGGADEIEEPTPLYGEVPIQYPLDLWDAEVEGVTLLRVRVTEMGMVDSVEVLEGSGYPAFDSAAVRGVLDLRYSPARRNGERTTVWATVPVHFARDAG